jgi:hypothetical protein
MRTGKTEKVTSRKEGGKRKEHAEKSKKGFSNRQKLFHNWERKRDKRTTQNTFLLPLLWTKKAKNAWKPVQWKGSKYLDTCGLKRLKMPEYLCTEKAENTWIPVHWKGWKYMRPVNWKGWNTWIPVDWKKGWKYLNTCELKRLKIPEYLWTEKAENTWIPVHWKGWKYLNTCELRRLKYLNTRALKRLKIPEYLWTEKAENTWIPVDWKGWKYLNTRALKRLKIPEYLCTERLHLGRGSRQQ